MQTAPTILKPKLALPPLGAACRAVLRAARIGILYYQVYETETWLAACAADGILDGLALRYIRADLERMRCRIAVLEAHQRAWRAH